MENIISNTPEAANIISDVLSKSKEIKIDCTYDNGDGVKEEKFTLDNIAANLLKAYYRSK